MADTEVKPVEPTPQEAPVIKPWEQEWVQKPVQAVSESIQATKDTVTEAVKGFKWPWERDWSSKTPEPTQTADKPAAGAPKEPATGAYFMPDKDSKYAKMVRSYYETQLKAESQLRHYGKDGNLLRSEKGAQGVSQVMPKTGDTPGYGVKPLQSETEEEFRRFGFDYMVAMNQKYKGDIRKALAAYNYGPGNVDKAIREARKAGVPWERKVPLETRNYLKKIVGNGDKVQREEGDVVNQELYPNYGTPTNPSSAERSRTSVLKEASNLPEYTELIDFLSERRAVPDIKTGYLSGTGEFKTPGFFKTDTPDRGIITVGNNALTGDNKGNDFSSGTVVHELTHAADRQINRMANELKKKSDLSPAEERFLDTFEKTSEYKRRGKDHSYATYAKLLANAINQGWTAEKANYRSSNDELMAFGMGNSARKGQYMYGEAPEHIDSSIATEFRMLLNHANAVAKEHSKTKKQGR